MSGSIFDTGGDDVTRGEAGTLLPLNIYSGRLERARVVKTGPGKLYGFAVYNNNAATQFILLFDQTAVPADGAAPVMAFPVATLSTLLVGYGDTGRAFNTGCVLANSSTPSSLTAGAADCWFDAQYV